MRRLGRWRLVRLLGRSPVRRHARLRRTGSGVHGRCLVRMAVGVVAASGRLTRLVRVDGMGHVRSPPWGDGVPKRPPHMDR